MAGPSLRPPISTPSRAPPSGSTTTIRAPCPACRRATTSSAVPWTSSGGPGGRWRSGRTPSPTSCTRPAWSRSSSRITPTCSRPAARTTTPTSPPGPTSAGTRGTPGRPGRIPAGRVRRSSDGITCPTMTAGAGSGWSRTFQVRGPCPPLPAGSRRTRAGTTGSSCSSTNSTRTSPSTPLSPGPRCTTPTIRARP